MRISSLALLFVLASCGPPEPAAIPADANTEQSLRETRPPAEAAKLPRAAEEGEVSPQECLGDGAACEIGRQAGLCLSGRCVTIGPGCTNALDCYDGNSCTVEQCIDGVCASRASHGTSCRNRDDAEGFCAQGTCEVSIGKPCSVNCDTENPCVEIRCASGVCSEPVNRPNGTECKTEARAKGTCADGACTLVDDGQAEPTQRCRLRYHPYRGVYRACSASGLQFALTDQERAKAVAELTKHFDEEVRYDLHVALVELPDGGYNIVTANKRTRDEVRGLVDPSFVALIVAAYTATTGWRSRQLLVWLDPFEEGWALPTSGSRKAMQEGRKASQLGFLGVIDVKPYREWLERSFRRLPAESIAVPKGMPRPN